MTRSLSARCGFVFLFVVVSLGLAGCGRSVGSVTGKVTYQDKTVKGGNVTFVSTDGGRTYASGIKEDGTYSIPDLQSGSYKVCVETASLKPPPGTTVPKVARDPASAQLIANSRKYVPIPDQYGDAEKTDVTYEFKGGSETFDINLK